MEQKTRISDDLAKELTQVSDADVAFAREELEGLYATRSEEIIGDMEDGEKIILALIIKKAKQIETSVKMSSEKLLGIRAAMSSLRDELFGLISGRLELVDFDLGIRSGFKIVTRDGELEDCKICPLRELCWAIYN